MPFFSICIPVYKNVHYVERLLNSIFSQTFTDYEVVITDDSPDSVIEEFLTTKDSSQPIRYYKNKIALGTPENWNEAIRKSEGEWIKLMHDDDWFCTNDALKILHDHAIKQQANFFFSAYNNVFIEDDGRIESINLPDSRWRRVLKYPPNLYARNVIGPPSVTLIRKDKDEYYDKRMKWLVDIDYYIARMETVTPVYISTPLINVGVGSLQVTTYTHNKPEVEIPEGLLLLSKIGNNAFDHILFFDAWWRLLRNTHIRSEEIFSSFSMDQTPPLVIDRMIKFQKRISPRILSIGIFSKTFMSLCWSYCRFFK